MVRRERREYVRILLTDMFVSCIEEAVIDGVISREEANEQYRDLKKVYPIPNLYPAIEILKANIKSRMASGVNAAVDLPVVKTKRKNMFDKAS